MGEVLAGRYELVDLLDSGGSGSVWRVWDRRERVYLAGKVLRHSDSDTLLRFLRETTRLVDHEHVLAPLGWAGEDDRVVFTMPLVTGGSLATLLGDFGALPPSWTAAILAQVADALHAVHDAGYAHRDVKPSNILLEPGAGDLPHAWLSDFGTAGRIDGPRLTAPHLVHGTPGYLSPEALRGTPPHPAQDIYALGVTGLEMLGLEPHSEVPAADGGAGGSTAGVLLELLQRMVDPDPAQRPATAHEVAEQLQTMEQHLGRADAGTETPEVFDHLPVLPPGWAEHGRVGGAAHARDDVAGSPPPGVPARSPDTRVLQRQPDPPPVDPKAPPRARSKVKSPALGWLLIAVGVVLLLLALLTR